MRIIFRITLFCEVVCKIKSQLFLYSLFRLNLFPKKLFVSAIGDVFH
nr:MAG TPA: hypothetical protein [Caudoviricetes sp.]